MKSKPGQLFDVIVVGELNVDLIFNQIDSFPETGKEKLAEAMTLTLGSSSAIFANNLSALGMRVSFIGTAGNDDFGHFCKRRLEAAGVDTSMLMMLDGCSTGATVVMNFGEDRAMVTHCGAMKLLRIDDITAEKISQGRHLHFSSCFLQPGMKEGLADLFKMARRAGLTTSLDAQWDPAERWDLDLEAILPHVDIFLPNETELLKITKRQSVDEALETIMQYANVIVIKRGNRGSLLCDGKRLVAGEPFLNHNVVDAIGAGDSFNAGFIFRYLQQHSLEKCQRFGNLTGAISTTAVGGTSAFSSYDETIKIAKEKFGYEG